MSNGTKALIIAAVVIVVLLVIIVRILKKIKRKVKAAKEAVDNCGEYASRILRIAGKIKDGETRDMLKDVADDFKLSDIKEFLESDNKLDAVLDMLEDEADAEETDYVKLSEGVAGLKDLLTQARGLAQHKEE